jgi:hypothetical protein
LILNAKGATNTVARLVPCDGKTASEGEMPRSSTSSLCSGSRLVSAGCTFAVVLAFGLTPVAALVLATRASAQQPATENPDALRPPTFLAYPIVSRQQTVVRLYFAEVTHALQSGDTTTLSVLVPDSVIPAAEKLNAIAKGCPSLSAAITRMRARTPVVGGLGSIGLDEVSVSPAGQGDTVAFGAAPLRVQGSMSGVSVALVRSGHARSMARVQGLLFALCTLAR